MDINKKHTTSEQVRENEKEYVLEEENEETADNDLVVDLQASHVHIDKGESSKIALKDTP